MVNISAPYRLGKVLFMILRLKQIQRLSATDLRELQNKRLRALIKHSYDHVPYYHSLFKKANLIPDNIKTVEDLHKIPVSQKKDLRNLPIKDIIADNIDLSTCEERQTSGTTGIPFHVYRDKKNLLLMNLSFYLWQLNCGDKITNKRVILGGSNTRPLPSWTQRLGIFRTKTISIYTHPQVQLQEIKEYNTRTLLGVPSNVSFLAKEVEESSYNGIDLSFIFTNGEFLDENTRSFIEETLKASLYRSYGATEAGIIGRECLEHRYHISDTVFVETTRDGETVSAGEEGEVTITNLVEYAQPFIRFDLQDLGMVFGEECLCGFHFPSMELTSGRMSDIIHLKDGRALSAHFVNSCLVWMQGIKQYQVIQETTDKLTIKLVRGQDFKDNTILEIKEKYRARVGDEMEVNVLLVDDIPREKSGKFKLFKTNIL